MMLFLLIPSLEPIIRRQQALEPLFSRAMNLYNISAALLLSQAPVCLKEVWA